MPLDKPAPPAAGQAAHTPTPWTIQGAEIRATGREFPTIICDPFSGQWENTDGTRRRLLPIDEREANAAFIVRACNNHDPLVAALENLLTASEILDGQESPPDEADVTHFLNCAQQARAALQAARNG